mmetsp:Transcript_8225/g.10762  ORF Transcript_8225/g.10762 Transcript_8225/m.10762 type:complete len:237 (-) Transcript_8225:91-801(-)|eukprot:CAMPEP_0198147584 /NCGR_PEP_ID=MMETSP1443-20131203/36792_1 /TAXON_ID=186043 /ORGANISM="Entomoneis sp., Strain CCMP2396" /LENGTH=236 /DNA_ID=CAMNT_0043811989 /DNA_START=33 /DNA_END=743 /DNA_ORIENTATION=-
MATSNQSKVQGKNNVIEVLSLLEQYEKVHVAGNDEWKKTLWNIYKSRHQRKRNNLSYASESFCSASDIREDLTPRLTLRPNKKDGTFLCLQDGVALPARTNESVPELEGDVIAIATSVSSTDEDAVMAEDTEPALMNDSTKEEGLRNRRQRPTDSNKNSQETKWTVEQNEQTTEDDDGNGERDSTTKVVIDPLELLAGAFPPKELKEAQKRAKLALQSYIEAANLLIRLRQETGDI